MYRLDAYDSRQRSRDGVLQLHCSQTRLQAAAQIFNFRVFSLSGGLVLLMY